MEPVRSSLHRLAPVALAALGIFGALLTIFAGLVALNHSVLPFNGWPRDAERLVTGRQVLPRAPVESGRLRTAPGGALAGTSPVVHVALPVAVTEPRTLSLVGVRLQRGTTHAAPPTVIRTPQQQQQQLAAPPQPSPVAAAPAPTVTAPPAPAVTPVVVSRAPVSRAPSTSTSTSSGPGRAHGRATAPGRLKKGAAQAARIAASAAPAAPAPPAPAAAPPGQDDGPGNGNANGHDNGHGPPPWAHGRH